MPRQTACSISSRVELSALLEVLILLLAEGVEVGKRRIVLCTQLCPVRPVCEAEFCVQPPQQDLDGVQLGVRETAAGAEEIPKEGDVLTEPGGALKSRRRNAFRLIRAIRPYRRLQRVDAVFTGHEVDVAPTQPFREVTVFCLGIQAEDRLAGPRRLVSRSFIR